MPRRSPASSAGPAAALDGDLDTRWISGRYGSAVGEWLEVRFDRPRPIGEVTVFASGALPVGAPPRRVRVSTAAGSRTVDLDSGGSGTVAAVQGVVAPKNLREIVARQDIWQDR